MTSPILVLAAIAIDRIVGDPAWLYSKIPHPVSIMAKFLMMGEKGFNRPALTRKQRKQFGGFVFGLYVLSFVAVALLIEHLVMYFLPGFIGTVIVALLASSLIAVTSLLEHVQRVQMPIMLDDLETARTEVSKIVGRDTSELDKNGVIRAAIESLAENFSDGVVAPIFWFVIFGFPGLVFYKAVNTADSLIGHENDRYRDFGYFAAKTDDVVNYIPARLTGLLLSLAALTDGIAKMRAGIRIMLRDADKHASPNAGWPEAAMAGILDIKLGGPRRYKGEVVDGAWFGDEQERDTMMASDITRGLDIVERSWSVILFALIIIIFVSNLLLEGVFI
ncbi:adenosylcobinamide-phosphate synthase CbiB [Kordiimonas sp. SCSIO 12610]|uniref:adenosylcobinamide-phosphate synthase CbiB n=1 Tax=Kordiimonas sp. SCSIO 12610 TaxID=2829597 RepID=UPI00210C3162|nr:adenosylcobinamide-phosphate synthase CbiB [Kordiimonas sp. SCSIO 12610]UTW55932.1 cobalamin biosynthesis protein CobD [Kordiimonas sp. SCSIO 12610]